MTKGKNGVVDEGERKQGEGSAPIKTTKTDMLPSISDSEELPLESKSGKVKERSIKISINHIPVEKPSDPTMKNTELNEISRKLDFE